MKVQELRIGNYVKAKYEDEASDDYVDVICEIDGIDGCGFSEHMYWLHPIEGESREEYFEVGPIPLTEQWLIDLHPGLDIKDNYYIIDRFRLTYVHNYNFWYVLDKESLTYITKVEFVHEWQNVFFILNGKELTKWKDGK